MLQIIVSNLRK